MSHEKPRMPHQNETMKGLLEGNKRFRKEASRRDPGIFERTGAGQSPAVTIISCSDSRVSPHMIFDLLPGEGFLTTVNAGNIVDSKEDSLSASVTYPINHLGSNLVLLIGHYECGGIKGLDSIGKGALEKDVEKHLKKALPAKNFVDSHNVSESSRHKAIVEANVLLGLERLKHHPEVKKALAEGSLELRGGVYDVKTGVFHEGYPTLERLGLVGKARDYFVASH